MQRKLKNSAMKRVAFVGPSGSGKTELTQAVASVLQKKSTKTAVIRQDSYYLGKKRMPEYLAAQNNFDHPAGIEWELLKRHVYCLQAETVYVPVYDFGIHERSETESKIVEPPDVLLLEGHLLLSEGDPHLTELMEIMDLVVYVDATPDECLARRLERDIKPERGCRRPEDILQQWRSTVAPMHARYVAKNKSLADIRVNNGKSMEQLLALAKFFAGGILDLPARNASIELFDNAASL